MKILPLQTLPPQKKIERRHTPPETTGRYGYREYRPCLRWEFGFTCAFCLLHEGDLADLGAEGMGLTWIEHFQPASLNVENVNEYGNCFYTCPFCNRSRGTAPTVDGKGRKLINPCSHAWAERFSLSDGRLFPDTTDPDAVYTAKVYDLNDPRKVERRRLRRERLEEWLRLLREGPWHVQSLIALSEKTSLAEAVVLVNTALSLRSQIFRAFFEIQRYAAVPRDSDNVCLCGGDEHHRLPEWLANQTQEIA